MKPDAEKTHETIEEFASDPGAAPEAAHLEEHPHPGAIPPPVDGESPWSAQLRSETDSFAQRPELYVGAALLGGLVLAQLLKRIGSD